MEGQLEVGVLASDVLVAHTLHRVVHLEAERGCRADAFVDDGLLILFEDRVAEEAQAVLSRVVPQDLEERSSARERDTVDLEASFGLLSGRVRWRRPPRGEDAAYDDRTCGVAHGGSSPH